MTSTHQLPTRSFPFDGDGVTAVVTTRHGGVSTGSYSSFNLGDHVGDDHDAVLENRRRLCAELRVDRLTVADQQHCARVAVIDAALAGRGHDGAADSVSALPATDAMVTNLAGVALTIMVADCACGCLRPGTTRYWGRALRPRRDRAGGAAHDDRDDARYVRVRAGGPARGHRPSDWRRQL